MIGPVQVAGAPPPEQLHLQFGSDAAREMTVSWATPCRTSRPVLRLGQYGYGYGTEISAEERTYTDALTGQEVWTYHARATGLEPNTRYLYQACHRGGDPAAGRFRTGPDGRSGKFRFSSFGDQSVPAPVGRGLAPWSPNAGYVVEAVEAQAPLFNLVNGDLSYANVSDDPVGTWRSYFTNIARSARNRPWMPCPGNHENEVGNGPQGYLAYQTRFALPPAGAPREFAGNWYSFVVGSVQVISLNNDDVCVQDGAFSTYRRDHLPGYLARGLDPYIRRYSRGAQKRWLERTLAGARANQGIDWIVVCMHQVAMSSAHFNGADLGIRQEWLPLFDRYGVDLVLTGHEHHYERTFPVRDVVPGSAVLTPAVAGEDPSVIDATAGAVHMILGGGGHPAATSPQAFESPPAGVLNVRVGAGGPQEQRPPVRVLEPADWSAYRSMRTPYGFATFDVDPQAAHGRTTITVTYHGAQAGSPDYRPQDRFVLERPARQLAGTGPHRPGPQEWPAPVLTR